MVKNSRGGGALETYRNKRSAGRTTEPFGGEVRAKPEGEALAFVVHKHAARHLHWDLRLETDGVLRSWAVPQGPSLDPTVKRFAVQTEDHPLEYLDFEGVIPDGNYGAGPMIVWDRGRWTPVEEPGATYEEGKLLFDLAGHKLRGRWTLVRTKRGEGQEWLLIKKPDGAARTGEPGFDQASILTGLEVEALRDKEQRLAELIRDIDALRAPRSSFAPKPMLAENAEAPFSDPGWLFELKYDGYRLIATKEGDRVSLALRSGADASASFPELTRTLAALPYPSLILDGEVVVLEDDGRPSFSRLAGRAKLSRRADLDAAMLKDPVTLYAFDLLAFAGRDLRALPLEARKALLARVVPRSGPIRYADHVEGAGEALFEQVKRAGIEGIIGKRKDAPYRAGRDRAWLKLRVESTDDFVIVGFTEPDGSRVGMGALHLASYAGESLVYRGRVGTGFTDAELVSLRKRLEPLEVPAPTCVGEDLPKRGKDRWVAPRLVAEVRYLMISRDGHLRFPVYLRLRDDKPPEECAIAPEVEEVAPLEAPAPEIDFVSNRDKLFWPEDGLTKGDLLDYYDAIAPWILPYLRDRLLVLTRFPDGIHGKSFFQRNAPGYVPDWVRRVTRYSEDADKDIEYFVIEDRESLLYVANLGTIPLHVWGSRLSTLEKPDWCILDLDPKDAPFGDVITIAGAAHALCEEIGLPSYLKTSGSTGLHVMIPLGRKLSFEQCRQLAQLLAEVLVGQLPEIATVERVMKKRKRRVYLDFGQNGHGRVLVAPYCARPVVGAMVSTPLPWSTLEGLDPRRYTIRTVPALVRERGDPLAPILEEAPDILAALERLARRL